MLHNKVQLCQVNFEYNLNKSDSIYYIAKDIYECEKYKCPHDDKCIYCTTIKCLKCNHIIINDIESFDITSLKEERPLLYICENCSGVMIGCIDCVDFENNKINLCYIESIGIDDYKYFDLSEILENYDITTQLDFEDDSDRPNITVHNLDEYNQNLDIEFYYGIPKKEIYITPNFGDIARRDVGTGSEWRCNKCNAYYNINES